MDAVCSTVRISSTNEIPHMSTPGAPFSALRGSRKKVKLPRRALRDRSDDGSFHILRFLVRKDFSEAARVWGGFFFLLPTVVENTPKRSSRRV